MAKEHIRFNAGCYIAVITIGGFSNPAWGSSGTRIRRDSSLMSSTKSEVRGSALVITPRIIVAD